MSEARTIREARLELRRLEAELGRVHMSPAMALAFSSYNVREARLALRRADRDLARSDDPRLDELKPLRPQISDRRPTTRPSRKRYRCPQCFFECLLDPEYGVEHRRCGVDMEPVSRRRPRPKAPVDGGRSPESI